MEEDTRAWSQGMRHSFLLPILSIKLSSEGQPHMSNSFLHSFFQIFSIIKGEYIIQFLVLVLFLFVQFFCCSVTQSYPSCPALRNPMDCSMSGFPVLPYLPEFAQTHVHWVDDTILCHPFLLLPTIFPSIRVFFNESALHVRWPKYWSFNFSIV